MNADSLRASATLNGDGNPGWPPPDGKMAPTLEECELLYALVRATRPRLVYETGTGVGISAAFIASALQANGGGRLLTYEPDPIYREQAQRNLEGLPVEHALVPYTSGLNPELVYIDSAPGLREREIMFWLELRSPRLVVVHDAGRQYDELALGRGINLPTQYGLWVGQAGVPA